jgi:hypothetical protein
MHLQFTYTPEDLQEMSIVATDEANKAAREAQRQANRGARGVIGWGLFVALAVFLFIMLNPNRTGRPGVPRPPADPWPQLRRILPWFSLFVVLWVIMFWFRRRAGRMLWKHNPVLRRPHTLDIDDDGVRLAHEQAMTQWTWPNFIGLTETENLLLLRQAKATYVIIPKRAVPEGQLDALRLLLAERVGLPGAFPVLPPKPT